MRPLDNRAFVLVATLVLVLACGMVFLAAAPQDSAVPPRQDTAAVPPPTPEEYLVLSAYIRGDKDSALPPMLILEEKAALDFTATEDEKSNAQLRSFLKKELAVDDTLVSEYLRVTGAPAKWDNSFSVSTQVRLISEEELHKYFGEGGTSWDGFHKDFPNAHGIGGFSRVAFNGDHSLALFYTSYTCGGLCGNGNYVLMKKINGEWKETNSAMAWIS